MADVFLSYARSDEGEIEKLSELLKQAGYTVWWDREIDGGTQFSEHIEEQLEKAKAVIVAWSTESVHSRWVRDEASVALDEQKLISITLDGSPPPLGFKQIHTINMTGPRGEDDLKRAVAHLLEREPVEQPTGNPAPEEPPNRRRRLVLAAIAAGVLAIGIPAVLTMSDALSGPASGTPATAPTVMAVLPFTVSGGGDQQDMGAALTSSMSSNLARLPNITIVSETSARAAAEQGLSAAELGRRLGVDHFIEGDVQSNAQRLDARVRLVEASSGKTIWADDIRGDPAHADEFEFLLLNRLSGILGALHAVASGEVTIPDDIDPRAYEAYLDGISMVATYKMDFLPQALRRLRVAVSTAPDFAEAHASIAYVLAMGGMRGFGFSRDEYLTSYRNALARAVELDPDNFVAKAAEAYFALVTEGQIEKGLSSADALLELRPDDPMALAVKASALSLGGRHLEAVNHIDRVIAYQPFNYRLENIRREYFIREGIYPAVRASALECRVDCWYAAIQWHDSLLKSGTVSHYNQDMPQIAELSQDERTFYTGENTMAESLDMHARFIVLGDEPESFPVNDGGSMEGIYAWTLTLFHYGYVDVPFIWSLRNIERAPSWDILQILDGHRLTPPDHVRHDPRYHEIFEAPQFKAVADYRRKKGMTNGLPLFPVKRAEESARR